MKTMKYFFINEIMDDGSQKLNELGRTLNDILAGIGKTNDDDQIKNLTAEDVVEQLQKKLDHFFKGEKIKVKLSDGIISDASAGSDYIKIKKVSSTLQI